MKTADRVQPGATIPDRRFFQGEVIDLLCGERFEPVVYDPGSDQEARDALNELAVATSLGGEITAFFNDTTTGRLLTYGYRARPDFGQTLLVLQPGAAIVLCPRRHTCVDLRDFGVSL